MAHDIFISYRRNGGEHLAGRVKDALKNRGFSVFMDVEDLKSGKFDTALLKEIEETTDVIVILTPGCLDRCKNENDWLRLEIRHAIKCKRNIVPIIARDFQMPLAANLPSDIAELVSYSGLTPAHEMFEASIDRLVSTFLMSRNDAGVKEAGMEVTEAGAGMVGVTVNDPGKLNSKEILRRANTLIRDDPSAHGYSLAGGLLSMAGLHTTAVSFLEKALQMDATDGNTWFNLAQNYEILGEHSKSMPAFIQATKISRDFAKILWEQKNTPELDRYLGGLEGQYLQTLKTRRAQMERAISELIDSKPNKDETFPVSVSDYQVQGGANVAQFIIHLIPKSVVITFCYPEELRDAEILMPFRIPKSVNFEARRLQFIEYFGYQEFRFNSQEEDNLSDTLYLCARLDPKKLNAHYLLTWILKSLMFQENGERFLKGEAFWDVQTDREK